MKREEYGTSGKALGTEANSAAPEAQRTEHGTVAKKDMPMTRREKIHTWIAVVMLVMGLAFMWAGFWTPPVGDISNSVLGAAGECFAIGGGLLGLTQYVHYSLRAGFKSIRRDLQDGKLRGYEEDDEG